MTTDQSAAERPLTEPGRRLVDKLDLAGRLSSDISFPDAEDDIAAIEAAVLADARARVEAEIVGKTDKAFDRGWNAALKWVRLEALAPR